MNRPTIAASSSPTTMTWRAVEVIRTRPPAAGERWAPKAGASFRLSAQHGQAQLRAAVQWPHHSVTGRPRASALAQAGRPRRAPPSSSQRSVALRPACGAVRGRLRLRPWSTRAATISKTPLTIRIRIDWPGLHSWLLTFTLRSLKKRAGTSLVKSGGRSFTAVDVPAVVPAALRFRICAGPALLCCSLGDAEVRIRLILARFCVAPLRPSQRASATWYSPSACASASLCSSTAAASARSRCCSSRTSPRALAMRASAFCWRLRCAVASGHPGIARNLSYALGIVAGRKRAHRCDNHRKGCRPFHHRASVSIENPQPATLPHAATASNPNSRSQEGLDTAAETSVEAIALPVRCEVIQRKVALRGK